MSIVFMGFEPALSNVCPSVCPHKVSSISMKFGM